MTNVVDVQKLEMTYAGPPEVRALRSCEFTIDQGEYVAITGPSGSGKTTLLSLLGLLESPTGGRYYLDGANVASLNDNERAAVRAHKIGFVFQAFHLVEYRSVIENVQVGLLYQGVGRLERRTRSIRLIEQVGLEHRASALCATLSGGERQRVALARALIRRPSLVLCDEPTGNLDSSTSERVLDLLGGLNGQGLTVVVVTHDDRVAARASRHLTIIDGQLGQGSSSDV